MSDADQTLAHIDEVLGFTDDMSIEWDYSTSPDAMRSRPADEAPAIRAGHEIDWIVWDETSELEGDAARWRALNERIAGTPPDPPTVTWAAGTDWREPADFRARLNRSVELAQDMVYDPARHDRELHMAFDPACTTYRIELWTQGEDGTIRRVATEGEQ